jgi:hypothetical protein
MPLKKDNQPTIQLAPWSRGLVEKLMITQLVKRLELRGLLLSSQDPASGPYPELDESSLYPHILFLR